jgi:hypothetical protein
MVTAMATSPSANVGSRFASDGDPAAVTGTVRWLLRAEGAASLLVCCVFYALTGFGWGYFALLFLVPDLSMLGYLAGPRVGSVAYNWAHTTAFPMVLGVAGFVLGMGPLPPLALIWAAHIGFDRMLGYGLKYPRAFGYTHLGRIGAARHDPSLT